MGTITSPGVITTTAGVTIPIDGSIRSVGFGSNGQATIGQLNANGTVRLANGDIVSPDGSIHTAAGAQLQGPSANMRVAVSQGAFNSGARSAAQNQTQTGTNQPGVAPSATQQGVNSQQGTSNQQGVSAQQAAAIRQAQAQQAVQAQGAQQAVGTQQESTTPQGTTNQTPAQPGVQSQPGNTAPRSFGNTPATNGNAGGALNSPGGGVSGGPAAGGRGGR
jgi:hypothetical protein